MREEPPPPVRSIRVALVNALVFAALMLRGYFGPELSDNVSVVFYVLLVIGCPIGGMVLTAIEARTDLARGANRLLVILALLVSAAVLLLGGRGLVMSEL